MSCTATLLQSNSQEILVPITWRGTVINTADLSAATYKLYDAQKRKVKLEKSLGNGITAQDSNLTIVISDTDSANLRGTYYHELTIVDPVKGRSTVFKQQITFEATKN